MLSIRRSASSSVTRSKGTPRIAIGQACSEVEKTSPAVAACARAPDAPARKEAAAGFMADIQRVSARSHHGDRPFLARDPRSSPHRFWGRDPLQDEVTLDY